MSGETIIETASAFGFATPYVLDVGDRFEGRISTAPGPADYVGIRVEEGVNYVVTVTPVSSRWDSTLRLLEEDRGFIAWGAQIGFDGTAVLKFVPDETGIFHIATDLSQRGTGGYTVSFETDPDFAPWGLSEIADYLTVGYWRDTGEAPLKWRFSDQGGAKVLTYDASALGDAGEAVAQKAFQAWTDVSGITFVASTNAADIVFTQGGYSAYATHQTDGYALTRAVINMYDTDFESRGGFVTYDHEVLVHEIGHALGLGHAGPYNGTGTYEVDALHAADTVRTSVMSYFRTTEQAFVDMYNDVVLTPMAADIIAIQQLYGPVEMNTGDTVYGQNADISDLSQLPTGLLGSYAAAFQDLLGEGQANLQRYTYTIKDDGGIDTLDYSRHQDDTDIDLTIAGSETVTTADRNIVLSPGTIIENAIGGRFQDNIIGNAVANTLSGNAGDDHLEGHGGADVLHGDAGDDLLLGGAGADALNGGSGDDLLFGDQQQARMLNTSEYQQIHRLYQAVLGRAPDDGGHENWTDQLVNDVRSLSSIADVFVGSVEFNQVYGDLSNQEFVTLLYGNVLDRAPDSAGLTGWINEINAGESRAGVVLGFSESAEFVAKSAPETAFAVQSKFAQAWTDDVFRLYQTTLDRAPDVTGLAGWANTLADGAAFVDVVSGFTHSAEFLATYGDINDRAFIAQMYQNVLDRTGSVAEIDAWQRVLDGGQSREDIVFGFSQSTEFQLATADTVVAWVRSLGWDDALDGGAGANDLVGGMMADRFIFKPTPAGENEADGAATYTVYDLEAWDLLDFADFGFSQSSDVFDRMAEAGNDVIFTEENVSVVLKDVRLAAIRDDMLRVSADDPFDIF